MSANAPILPFDDLDPAALLITHVRGPVTRQVREVVLKEGGASAWQTLLDQVSPECRAVFSEDIGMFEWIEARLSAELSLAYLSQGDPAFTERRSEAAAQEVLTRLNRWVLRMLSTTFLVNAFPKLFGLYYRGGKVIVDAVGDSHALISLWADGFYPAWYSQGLPAVLRTGLKAAGASQVTVSYSPPQGEGVAAYRHQYEVHWK